jgi:hypothetical protein
VGQGATTALEFHAPVRQLPARVPDCGWEALSPSLRCEPAQTETPAPARDDKQAPARQSPPLPLSRERRTEPSRPATALTLDAEPGVRRGAGSFPKSRIARASRSWIDRARLGPVRSTRPALTGGGSLPGPAHVPALPGPPPAPKRLPSPANVEPVITVQGSFAVGCRRFHNVAYCHIVGRTGLEPVTSGLSSRSAQSGEATEFRFVERN